MPALQGPTVTSKRRHKVAASRRQCGRSEQRPYIQSKGSCARLPRPRKQPERGSAFEV